jgi:hypothetical protein
MIATFLIYFENTRDCTESPIKFAHVLINGANVIQTLRFGIQFIFQPENRQSCRETPQGIRVIAYLLVINPDIIQASSYLFPVINLLCDLQPALVTDEEHLYIADLHVGQALLSETFEFEALHAGGPSETDRFFEAIKGFLILISRTELFSKIIKPDDFHALPAQILRQSLSLFSKERGGLTETAGGFLDLPKIP